MSKKEVRAFLEEYGPVENESIGNGCMSKRPKTAKKKTATRRAKKQK